MSTTDHDEILANLPHDEFPASFIVHWPTGPVYCCTTHGEGLVKLSNMMGAHVGVVPYSGPEPCGNCKNEAKKND